MKDGNMDKTESNIEDDSIDGKQRIIPLYAYTPLIICVSFCSFLYFITKYLGIGEFHHIVSKYDEMIPFVPVWSSIYLLCYFFWIANAILIAREGRKKWYVFMSAYLIAEIFCNIVFIVFPTTMTRPEVTGNGIFDLAMKMIYFLDLPYNLLPSIHCMLSWLLTRGIIGSDKVPKWYQMASIVISILIFLSTLFTKQHVIVDIFTGVLVAEGAIFMAGRSSLPEKLEKVFSSLDKRIFKGAAKEDG